MTSRRPEVADVFRKHQDDFLSQHGTFLSSQQRQAYNAIIACRTAALGGHKRLCHSCGYEEISYNSCRNRHCPKCQAAARAEWMEREAEHLLDVEYFHVVFTLPAALRRLVLSNQRELYGALFRSAAGTLLTIGKDPKHLGAELGFVMVLHTWGQTLEYHPHVHCVVPGGGLSADSSRWIPSRKGFFLPVRVLSRLFRAKFLAALDALYQKRQLVLAGSQEHLREPRHWKAFGRSLRKNEWVVYAKPPFDGPERVLKYLARYTHRVAISNQRLVRFADGKVTFRWKDYASGRKNRLMTLDSKEFIRRFLRHVLPKSFVRIRHYGFLSNRSRRDKLQIVRRLVGRARTREDLRPPASTNTPQQSQEHNDSQDRCPRCRQPGFLIVAEIPKAIAIRLPAFHDTS